MKMAGMLLLAGLFSGATVPAAEKPAAAPTTAPTTKPAEKPKEPWEQTTDKQIKSITYEDAEIDNGFEAPLSKDLEHLDDDQRKALEAINDKLDDWAPLRDRNIAQQIRYYMALCTLRDLGHGEFEAELPYVIFDRVKKEYPKDKLIKALAYIILHPDDGKIVRSAKEVDVEEELEEDMVRERHVIYAKKLLGRLLGKLPPKDE